MLKPAPDPAKGFLADTKIRSHLAEGNPLQDMRGLLHQLFISFASGFELGIYKALLKADIIFFISDPDQSFYFMEPVE